MLCRSHAVSIEIRSFHVVTHVTALRPKMCHLTEVTGLNILVEEGTREIKVLKDKGKTERE